MQISVCAAGIMQITCCHRGPVSLHKLVNFSRQLHGNLLIFLFLREAKNKAEKLN